MKTPLKDRIAFRLERYRILHPILFRYDGVAPNARVRYVNRINGHIVLRDVVIRGGAQ